MNTKKYSRRKNRKIKFNEELYVQKHYFKDDKAVIPIELKEESDLYMEHDFKKLELADSVCAYIEEIAYMVPINTDIVLEIHCPKLSRTKQEKMKTCIRNNYGMEIDDLEYDMRVQNRRSIIFLIIGIILVIVDFLLEKYTTTQIISDLICVVWWVAIWNVIEVQTIDRVETKEQRLNYQQLYDAKVTFRFDK